jgi:putative ABC transport system ATP-binding protein
MLLARLLTPSQGKILINDQDIATLPESITGRRIAYAGPNAYLCNASIEDNLIYGLKHNIYGQPTLDEEKAAKWAASLAEAKLAGNSEYDFDALNSIKTSTRWGCAAELTLKTGRMKH